MRPTPRITTAFLFLIVAALMCFATSCVTGADGVKRSPAVFQLIAKTPDGKGVAVIAASDLNTSVVYGGGEVYGQVVLQATAMSPAAVLFGPVGSTFGKVFMHDKAAELKVSFDFKDPWPAQCARLFPLPGQAEALGITFADAAGTAAIMSKAEPVAVPPTP